jgi:hypothetical protein
VLNARIVEVNTAAAEAPVGDFIGRWPVFLRRTTLERSPNITLAAKAADILSTTDGLVCVMDWNAGLNVLQYEG